MAGEANWGDAEGVLTRRTTIFRQVRHFEQYTHEGSLDPVLALFVKEREVGVYNGESG